MTTKSHKTLTGSQLHEPKGADTAAADKVYVSDGLGSGTWQKLTASQLTTTGNPFGAQLFHVREVQNSGVSSTCSLSLRVYGTRVLNTVVTNEITSASLASNQISLPVGSYYIEAVALIGTIVSSNSAARLSLYNITDASPVVQGITIGCGNGGVPASPYTVSGRFVLSGTKTLELRSYQDGSSNSFSGGQPVSQTSVSEIYADVKIWKVA